MPDKSQKLVNTGINTDPLNWEEFDLDSQTPANSSKLKKRNDVKHVHITDSSTLHESYDYGELLGQGSFGKVISICDKQTGSTWAMKIIPKSVPKKMTSINREILILKLVKHPHIIYLHKVFESGQKIYLILEKCIGELKQRFQITRPFSEGDTKTVILQLSSAVDYLHKNEIVHRDLKLENILLAQNPKNPKDELFLKVSDFGLGFVKGAHYERLHDRCGTLTYISPEIIMKGNYSQQCDIWAMGVIMYLLMTGDFPFYSTAESELTKLICHAEPKYTGLVATVEAIHLMKKMLEKDPALRITAGEVCLHPWLNGKLLNDKMFRGNVLDMMKMWKQEMMAPRGSDCDWITASITDDSRGVSDRTMAGRTGRQSMSLPVHNIEFNRGKGGATDSGARKVSAVPGMTTNNATRPGLVPRSIEKGTVTSPGKPRMPAVGARRGVPNPPKNTTKTRSTNRS